MNRIPKSGILAAVALLAAALAGCAAPDTTPAAVADESAASVATTPKIVVAIQPTDNAAKIQSRATELEQFLETETGYDIEIVVPLTYAGTVEALRFGHADVAFMGSWPAALAAKHADARIVLAENRDVVIGDEATVAPYYYSYYVVLADSPYQTLEDLRGKTVAYPSLTSGSGYLYPVAKLVELGLVPAAADGKEADPAAFFGNVHFAGGYAQAWDALRNGQADVAVTAGDIKASLYYEVLNGTRIIQEQGPIPSHAVVFADDFQGEEADVVKAALLQLKDDKKQLMRDLVSGIFVEFVETTTEEHVGPLSEALELAGFKMAEKLG